MCDGQAQERICPVEIDLNESTEWHGLESTFLFFLIKFVFFVWYSLNEPEMVLVLLKWGDDKTQCLLPASWAPVQCSSFA